MLQLTPLHRIWVACEPTDFRKGIDALIGICRQHLKQDPFSGQIFVFTNRRRTGLKLLVYDGQGFWLCHKRLSSGRWQWWPNSTDSACKLSASELSILLYNGNPKGASLPEDWRSLPMPSV